MKLINDEVKFKKIFVTDYSFYYSFKKNGYELALEPLIAGDAEGMAVCIYDTEKFDIPDLVGTKINVWLTDNHTEAEAEKYFITIISEASKLYKEYMSDKPN